MTVMYGLLTQFDELDVDGHFKSEVGPRFLKEPGHIHDLADFKFGPGSASLNGVAELHNQNAVNQFITLDTTGKSWRLSFWFRPAAEGGTILLTNGTKTLELDLGSAFFNNAFVGSWNHGGGSMGSNAQRPPVGQWSDAHLQYRRSNPRRLELFSRGQYIGLFPGTAPNDDPFAGVAITRVRFNGSTKKYDSTVLQSFDAEDEHLLYPVEGYTVPTTPFALPPEYLWPASARVWPAGLGTV